MIKRDTDFTVPRIIRIAEQIDAQTGGKREIIVGRDSLAVKLKPAKIRQVTYSHLWLWVSVNLDDDDDDEEEYGEVRVDLANTGPWPSHPHINKCEDVNKPYYRNSSCLDPDTRYKMSLMAGEGDKWVVVLNLAEQLSKSYNASNPLREVPNITKCRCGSLKHHKAPAESDIARDMGSCQTCNQAVCDKCGEVTITNHAVHSTDDCLETVELDGEMVKVAKGMTPFRCTVCAKVCTDSPVQTSSGDRICSYCAFRCDYCREFYDQRENTYAPGFCCKTCYEKAVPCTGCNKKFMSESMKTIEGHEGLFCNNCVQWCQVCRRVLILRSGSTYLCSGCAESHVLTVCCGNYRPKEQVNEHGICTRHVRDFKLCTGPKHPEGGEWLVYWKFSEDRRTSDGRKKLCGVCESHSTAEATR